MLFLNAVLKILMHPAFLMKELLDLPNIMKKLKVVVWNILWTVDGDRFVIKTLVRLKLKLLVIKWAFREEIF